MTIPKAYNMPRMFSSWIRILSLTWHAQCLVSMNDILGRQLPLPSGHWEYQVISAGRCLSLSIDRNPNRKLKVFQKDTHFPLASPLLKEHSQSNRLRMFSTFQIANSAQPWSSHSGILCVSPEQRPDPMWQLPGENHRSIILCNLTSKQNVLHPQVASQTKHLWRTNPHLDMKVPHLQMLVWMLWTLKLVKAFNTFLNAIIYVKLNILLKSDITQLWCQFHRILQC